MILMTHVTMETLPKTSVFTQSSIPTAWHIAENSIELKVLTLATLLQIWEFSSIIICNKHGWQI